MAATIGVRALRERLALTQAELAERAGLRRISVINAEAWRSLRPDTVCKPASALEVPPELLTAPRGTAFRAAAAGSRRRTVPARRTRA